MYENDVSLIFCSCDAFSDLWENFFRLFDKYWHEFDGQIILNTETEKFQYGNLLISEPLNCSDALSWEDRLKLALDRVKTPYVLIFLEDYYLKNPVDNARFLDALAYMNTSEEVKAITFLNEPGGFKPSELAGFQVRKHFSQYKVTGHITLWRKDYLMRILRGGESAWNFEVNGTVRSWLTKGVFLCKDKESPPIFPYDWGLLVNRGRYYAPVLKHFQSAENLVFKDNREVINEIPVDDKNRLFKKLKYFWGAFVSIFKPKM